MRLRRASVDRPGFSRRGRGTGFSYLDADGKVIRDAEVVERIRALAIPPAWRDVWICPYPNGHIQAVGTDEAGRRQYLYHEQWRTDQDADKHERVRRLVPRLPAFRKAVDRDLCAKGLNRERVLAVALRMLDYGVFRTGNTQYAEEYGSRGAATLLRDDVQVKKGQLVFDFTAKGGVRRTLELEDSKLVAAVTALKRSRHKNPLLLVYRDRDGWHEITADQINERFHELVGDGYTVKDLRTWTATVHAAVALAAGGPAEDQDGHEGRGQGDADGGLGAPRQHPGGRPGVVRRPAGDHAVRGRPHHRPRDQQDRREPRQENRPAETRTLGRPPSHLMVASVPLSTSTEPLEGCTTSSTGFREPAMRLSDLLGRDVVDANGDVIGHVADVRLVQDGPRQPSMQAALRIDGLIIVEKRTTRLLGYERHVGPALIRWLVHRHLGEVWYAPWAEVDQLTNGQIEIRTGRPDLQQLEDLQSS